MQPYSCHGNKISVGSRRIEKLEAIVTPPSKNGHLFIMMCKKAFCKVQWLKKMQNRWESP